MPGSHPWDSGWLCAGRAGFQESGSSWAILMGGQGGKTAFLATAGLLGGQLPVSAPSLRIPAVPAPWPPLFQGFVNAPHSASLTPPCGRASPLHLGSCTSTRRRTSPGEGRGHGPHTRWLHFCGQQQTWWAGKGGNAWCHCGDVSFPEIMAQDGHRTGGGF